MKLFTQILILIGFVITMVKATAENNEIRLFTPVQGLFVNPLEVDFPVESDYLVIPDGIQEGAIISKQKLGTFIAERSEDILEVDNISIVDELYFIEGILRGGSFGFFELFDLYDFLTLSFRITKSQDSSADVHSYIQCQITSGDLYINLFDCESEEVTIIQPRSKKTGLMSTIAIPMSDIIVPIEEYEESTTS